MSRTMTRALTLTLFVLSMAGLLVPDHPSIPVGSQEMTLTSARDNTIYFDNFTGDISHWTHGGTQDEWELGTPVTSGGDPGPDPGSIPSSPNVWGTDLDDYYNNGADCWLKSPAIDLRLFSTADLDFWLWYDVSPVQSGQSIPLENGTLFLEISRDDSPDWEVLREFSYSPNEEQWLHIFVSLDDHVSSKVNIRWRLFDNVSKDYQDNGVYIDDVQVTGLPVPNNDVAVVRIDSPPAAEIDEPYMVVARVDNVGLQHQSSFKVSCQVHDLEDDLLFIENLTVKDLSPLDSVKLTWNYTPTELDYFTATVTTLLDTDEDASNDEDSITVLSTHLYFIDMVSPSTEGDMTHFANSGSDLWHVVKDTYLYGRSYSPVASWWCGDDATGTYGARMDASLVTPEIDLTDGINALLYFRHWYSFEDDLEAWDGGIIEASTDGGSSWSQIDPYYGYDDILESGSGNPLQGKEAFCHSSNGWEPVYFVLDGFIGEDLSIRFRMGSDISNHERGWYIDDIIVYGDALSGGIESIFRDGMEEGDGSWTTNGSSGDDLWHITTRDSHRGSHSWWCGDESAGTYLDLMDDRLTTNLDLRFVDSPVRFGFWHRYTFDSIGASENYDGGIVEVSSDGTTWTQVSPLGGYGGTIDTGNNPNVLAGKDAFVGGTDWHFRVIDLESYLDQMLQLRFRFGSSANNEEEGWFMDDVILYGRMEPLQYAVEISTYDLSVLGAPGRTTELFVNVTNAGNAEDTVELGVETEFDHSISPAKKALAPQETFQFQIEFHVPSDAVLGSAEEVVITAQSLTDIGASASLTIDIDIIFDGIALIDDIPGITLRVRFTGLGEIAMEKTDDPNNTVGGIGIFVDIDSTVPSIWWANLTIDYVLASGDTSLIQKETLRIYRWLNGLWAPLGTTGTDIGTHVVWANMTSFSLLAPIGELDKSPPPPVSGITLMDMGNGSARIQWNHSSADDVSHYRIYRQEFYFWNVTGLTPVANVSDSTFYIDTDLQFDTIYFFTVVAVDHAGNINPNAGSVSIELSGPPVVNLPPIANITLGSDSIYVGTLVYFYGMTSSDPDGDIVTFSWDFDNSNGVGTDSDEMNPRHSYNKAGEYQVSLKVTDDLGLSDTAELSVLVRESEDDTVYVSEGDSTDGSWLWLILVAIIILLLLVSLIFFRRRVLRKEKEQEKDESDKKKKRRDDRKGAAPTDIVFWEERQDQPEHLPPAPLELAPVTEDELKGLLEAPKEEERLLLERGKPDEAIFEEEVTRPDLVERTEETRVLIQCPACKAKIRAQVPASSQEEKVPLEITCPECGAEGEINW